MTIFCSVPAQTATVEQGSGGNDNRTANRSPDAVGHACAVVVFQVAAEDDRTPDHDQTTGNGDIGGQGLNDGLKGCVNRSYCGERSGI